MSARLDVRRPGAASIRAAALAVALLPLGALAAGATGTTSTGVAAGAEGAPAATAGNGATASNSDIAAKVAAAAAGKRPETHIPFADHGGIWSWQVVDRDTLLIQGRDRRWYKAELMGPCIDLPFAQAIGFKSNPTGDFDQFSSVVVRGQECHLHSLTETAPPATSHGRHSTGATTGAATKSAKTPAGPAPAKAPQ